MEWTLAVGHDGCAHAKEYKVRPWPCLASQPASRQGRTVSHLLAWPGQDFALKSGERPALSRLQKAFRFLLQRPPWPPLQCQTCPGPDAWRGRLHLCLHCVQVGCTADPAGHMRTHFAATDQGHYLAVDTTHLQVFCFKCNDYMYARAARLRRAQAQPGPAILTADGVLPARPFLPCHSYDAFFERVLHHERAMAVETYLPADATRVPCVPAGDGGGGLDCPRQGTTRPPVFAPVLGAFFPPSKVHAVAAVVGL